MNNQLSLATSNKSIVVLPFVNMSTDPENEYFSDGLTEEIINALTTINGLKVIARTSSFAFKDKNIDVRTIGEQLGVSSVLEGSVRKVNNRVRVTAQLINSEDGTHFWSKNFDRDLEDIFALQDEISLLIADQIRENFGHLDIPIFTHDAPTENIEAYDLFLKGCYHHKRKDFDDIKKAMHFFQAAIVADPNYAEAYAFLGETYISATAVGLFTTKEGHDLARKAARNSIALNEQNAQAYKVLAFILLFYDWDWTAALDAYNKAVEYGLPDQNEFITYYYIFIEEDFEKAIQVTKKATEIDPLHVISHWQLGLTYYFARRFEESIDAFNKTLELDSNYTEAIRFRGLVNAYLGNYQEALLDINKAIDLTSGQGPATLDLLVVKILMGKKDEVVVVLKKSTYTDSADPAFLYALLDMPEEAIYYLDKALEERSVTLVTIKNYWVWDNLRDHPRFQAVYSQMNFPPSSKNKNKLDPVRIAKSATDNTSPLNKNEIDTYLTQLNELMTIDKVFIDQSLSLRILADKLALHPNKLSWLLNEHVGKNFNEFINAFRIETFKEKALDSNSNHLTLLGLAFDSGFNSKTVFNASFKKSEGMTPREWVKNYKTKP